MSRILIYILIFLSVSSCRENAEGKHMLSDRFERQEPVCFGQHLIDMPQSFVQANGLIGRFVKKRASADEEEVEIQVEVAEADMSLSEFSKRASAREATLRGGAWGGMNILKDARKLDDNIRVFQVHKIEDAYTTEIHAMIEGIYLIMTAASYRNQYAFAEAQMVNFLKGVSAGTSSIPAADDFCLGAVTIRGDFEKERAGFLFRNKRFPDVMISIDYDTYIADASQGLLARVDGPQSLLHAFNADNKVMRKGDLNVASMPAQEWLSWIVLGDDEKAKNYGFALETMRRTPSRVQPMIHVELDAKFPLAGQVSAGQLSESEIIGLWDATTRSIRLRESRQQRRRATY